MIGYRFLRPAEEEMTEASVFYEAATLGLGAGFLDEVQRVINILREHPELGQPVGQGLRRALLHRFPFSLIYSVEVDEVLVVGVAHQRRRPGYWRDRT
jgi:plasmid stabilization system protein ParE